MKSYKLWEGVEIKKFSPTQTFKFGRRQLSFRSFKMRVSYADRSLRKILDYVSSLDGVFPSHIKNIMLAINNTRLTETGYRKILNLGRTTTELINNPTAIGYRKFTAQLGGLIHPHQYRVEKIQREQDMRQFGKSNRASSYGEMLKRNNVDIHIQTQLKRLDRLEKEARAEYKAKKSTARAELDVKLRDIAQQRFSLRVKDKANQIKIADAQYETLKSNWEWVKEQGLDKQDAGDLQQAFYRTLKSGQATTGRAGKINRIFDMIEIDAQGVKAVLDGVLTKPKLTQLSTNKGQLKTFARKHVENDTIFGAIAKVIDEL